MLMTLFQRLMASTGVAFRTIRAFFLRQFTAAVARVRSVTSLTRQAAKLAPAMMKTAAIAGKKPTRREDYIETRELFISKSFLILLLIVVCAGAALFILVVWPWLVRMFFTAHLWREDEKAATYSGRVILYYDAEKELAEFEGELKEGVIQGKGVYYDENGLVVYSGSYVDGVYEGQGSLYADGALLYEGAFSGGVYEGSGTLYGAGECPVYEGEFSGGVYEGTGRLYQAGTDWLLYEGAFSGGVYEGEGKLYDAQGRLCYEGTFSSGERSGTGTAYAEGVRLYKGEFSSDVYDGEGILYDADGNVRYRGGFADGVYEGTGTLTLESGVSVTSTFAAGEPEGIAQCYADGKLYYEGELKDLLPEGEGTVYSAVGKSLYTGPMKAGSIDAGALLGLTAEDIRGMLGEEYKESVESAGFRITSAALGLTVFCSFAQEGAEATVYYVYLYAPTEGSLSAPLLWSTASAFEAAGLKGEEAPASTGGGTAYPGFVTEIPVSLGASPWCWQYDYGDYTLRLWSTEKDGALTAAEWSLEAALPQPEQSGSSSSDSSGRVAALMESLGLVSVEEGVGDISGLAGGNPYCGTADPAQLLSAVEWEDRTALATALVDYLEYAELRVAAEENLALYEELIAAAQTQVDTGTGDASDLAQLQDSAARLEVEISSHMVQMRKAERSVESLSGGSAADCDVQSLLTLYDVGAVDSQGLGEAMVSQAKLAALEAALAEAEEKRAQAEAEAAETTPAETTPVETTPAETTPAETAPAVSAEPVIPEVDTKSILLDMEERLLELELARQYVEVALREYETALAAAEEAGQAYAVGTATERERAQAEITANELRGALYSALAAFARKTAELNEASGGWLAEAVGWLPETMGK